jgi:TRAP-type C4-dicarboxylate transport system substrate-binding protein
MVFCNRSRNRCTPMCAALLAIVGAPLLAPTPSATVAGEAKPTEIKVSVAVGPALPLGKAAERWAQLVTEAADAGLAAKVYPGASLAGRDAAREFETLKDGNADVAVGSALQWSLQVPALGVFALPWIAPEPRALEVLASSDPLRSVLAARLEAQGVVLVALASLGHREVATTTRAIRSPDDVKGLRLRASPSPMVHDVLLALGAHPQAMSFAESQAAFARGALDGQEGTPTALAMARAGSGGQKYLTSWGGIGDAMVFAVRKPLWDGWGQPQREAVRRAALQSIAETGVLARDEAAVRRLAQNGVAVVRITAAGHDAFRAAVRDVSARWREAVGGDVVSIAEKSLAATAADRDGEVRR